MTKIRDTDGPAPELVYTMTTVPDAVVAGATGVQIIITAINPSPDPDDETVGINSITIQMPIGDGQNQLSQAADMSPSQAPENWTLTTNTSTGFVQFVYAPAKPPAEIGSGGLQFTFTNVNINDPPGIAEIDLTENNADYTAVQPFYLTKFPSSWSTISFWVDPANIPYQGGTTLNWSGPDGPTYTIQYMDYDTNTTVNIPAAGQQPLANQGTYPGTGQSLPLMHTTAFTFNATQTINGQNIQRQFQQTVTVGVPQPQIQSFSGALQQKTTTSPRTIDLSWACTNTTYCELGAIPGTQPTVFNNFPAAPAVAYSLTAVLSLDDGTQLTDQWNRLLCWAVAGSLQGNNIGLTSVGLAFAPDGSRLYVADGAVWVFTPNEDDSNPLQQNTNLYIAANLRQYVSVAVYGSQLYVAAEIYQSSGQNFTTEIQTFSASSLTQIGSGVAIGHLANVTGMAVCTGSSGSYLFASVSVASSDPASLYVFSITGDSSNPLQAFGGALGFSSIGAMGTSPDGTQLLVLTADGGGAPLLMAYEPTGNPDNPLSYVAMYYVPDGSVDFAVGPGQTYPAAVSNAQGQVTVFDFASMTIGAASAPIDQLIAIAIAPDGSRVYAVDSSETIWALVPGDIVAP
jgi:hypothetical protein